MALFACVAKLYSRAYGARHARVRPSIMQWVLAVRSNITHLTKLTDIVATLADQRSTVGIRNHKPEDHL